MIPAPPGTVAVFGPVSPAEGQKMWPATVVAFNDDGAALVISESGSDRLLTVAEFLEENPDHKFLFLDNTAHLSLSVIPGDGWMVERTESGKTWSEPVIAWSMQWSGSLVPLVKMRDGSVEDLTGTYRLHHPREITH